MVVAMPWTGVSDEPVRRLSTVFSCQGTPTCCLMRAMTSPAVMGVEADGVLCDWPRAAVETSAQPEAMNSRRDIGLIAEAPREGGVERSLCQAKGYTN